MNVPTETSAPQSEPESNPPVAAPAPRPLTAALVAAGDAVQNELREANELAASLDEQLAGKSKEVLHLKFVLDRTKAHFGHLQDSVAALRKERHQLANDAMKCQGLEMMVTRITAERDRLHTELNAAFQSLAARNAQPTPNSDRRDQTIVELTFENVKLRQELADLRRLAPGAASAAAKPSAPPPRSKPLEQEDAWDLAKVEIVPSDYVPGKRGNR